MSYFETINRLLAGFSEVEKEQLVHRLEIDFSKPEQLHQSHDTKAKLIKRIVRVETNALKRLHPEREFSEPSGLACSLCGRTESEVSDMAMHESGFNVCGNCVNLCAEVIREMPDT